LVTSTVAVAVAAAFAFLVVIPAGDLLLHFAAAVAVAAAVALPVSRRHPERSEGPLYFAVAVAFLSVILAGAASTPVFAVA
jgi:hypothetical protein